ncbi:MAG: HEAT repeat domain-containing protein [Gemmatimonadota bacterium]|nr:HEAT repeat domain-containing protein [Gemmatimonadota bacterium]
MRIALLAGLALIAAPMLEGQSLASRIDRVKDGTVRLSFPAREGVCGNGRGNISTYSKGSRGEWEHDCESGPVRVVIDRAGGRSTALRAYVGGQWRGTATQDLGAVDAKEAADWLFGLAGRNEGASEDAIFPATLAEGVETWPGLLRIVRNDRVSQKTRRSAIFWLGQAAGEAATKGLDSIVQDDNGDREVRESAIFALSQRPREEGIPALIRVARTSQDPKLRKTALFWLGQSEAPEAVALFEEILTEN